MNKVKFVLFAAGISLALAFAFGCSSGDESENSGGNGSLSSSSKDKDNHSSNSVAGISSSGGGVGLSSSSNGGSSSSSSSNLSSSSSFGQSSSAVLYECDAIFNPDNKFCYDGAVYDKCDGNSYNPVTQGCLSGKVEEKCGGKVYSQAAEFCYDNRIYDKCDGMTYNPTTHICQYKVATPAKCGSESYNPVTQGCCNGTIFSQTTQRCLADKIEDKCGDTWYSQATQFCVDNKIYTKCNGESYNPLTQGCCYNTIYSATTQFCSGYYTYTKCNGESYNPRNQFCSDNDLLSWPAGYPLYLYFYPPDMAEWISDRSYIYDMEHVPKPLELDTNLCGWYKTTIPAGVDAFQIWLGSSGVDKIGPLGKQSDDPKYKGGTNYYQLGGFYTADVFGSRTMYFIPDELDPKNPSSGWHTSIPSYIPTSGSRCNSSLATFIYDTDIRGTGFQFKEYLKNEIKY